MRNVARSRLIWGTALIAVVTTAVAVTFLVTQFGYNQVSLHCNSMLVILPFLKGDILITTTTKLMTTTSTTTTMIPTTTRPIPTFTPIPITSRSTAKSTPVTMPTVATTAQVTIPRTIYATKPFVKGSKILILNSRNVHKSMTISEKNNFQNANITFELGTQAYKACSAWFLFSRQKGSQRNIKIACAKSKPGKVTFKNEFYLFGGRTEDRQVSKLQSCSVKKQFDLPFDFQFGACGTYTDFEESFKT